MASVRLLVRHSIGKAWKEASEEQREEMLNQHFARIQAWRRGAGAGVRYVCYYSDPNSFDGYSHHTLFEVDDESQVRAIKEFYAQDDALDRLAFNVVSGGTFYDEIWTS